MLLSIPVKCTNVFMLIAFYICHALRRGDGNSGWRKTKKKNSDLTIKKKSTSVVHKDLSDIF